MAESTPVPPEVQPLLELAKVWATNPDDIDQAKLDAASPDELREFVAKFDEVGEGYLVPYLLGPAQQDDPASPEYKQLNWLLITVNEARFKLMYG